MRFLPPWNQASMREEDREERGEGGKYCTCACTSSTHFSTEHSSAEGQPSGEFVDIQVKFCRASRKADLQTSMSGEIFTRGLIKSACSPEDQQEYSKERIACVRAHFCCVCVCVLWKAGGVMQKRKCFLIPNYITRLKLKGTKKLFPLEFHVV